jgi:hypothetical protein
VAPLTVVDELRRDESVDLNNVIPPSTPVRSSSIGQRGGSCLVYRKLRRCIPRHAAMRQAFQRLGERA